MVATKIDVQRFDEFITYFHSHEWIDKTKTRTDVVMALKDVVVYGKDRMIVATRGSGVTTIVAEFCKFFRDVSKLLIVSARAVDLRKQSLPETNTHISAWRVPFRGLRPRPEFCIVDVPLSPHEMRSPATFAHFSHVLDQIEIPKLVVTTTD